MMQWLLSLKNRIFSPWNTRRILYTLVGGAIVVQSVLDKRWWLVIAGGYFFFMGLLAYGCAGGACNIPHSRSLPEGR